MIEKIAICILVLGVFLCGCTEPLPDKTGSVTINSSPSGAEVYLDNEYHGTTPAAIRAIPAGNHTIEIRERGYITWSRNITVTSGSNASFSPSLVSGTTTVTTSVPVTSITVIKKDIPQIHIDGYWTWPSVRSTTNPESILVHVEGANVGYADAREVTTSANMYLDGRQICWTSVYLGTIQAGGHVTVDTMISCSLPADVNSQNVKIAFENVVIKQ
jgi:hypothetical protein